MRKLKKKDARGLWRFWWAEVKDDHYITYSQLYGSQVRQNEPTYPRKNRARTRHQQAQFEVDALYAKRKRLGWAEEHPGRYNERPAHRFFAPMLAHKYPKYQLAYPAHAQPKLDGIRCITSPDGLWSRKNTEITSVPHLRDAALEMLRDYPEMANLDGELYLHGWPLNKISGLARLKKPSEESLKLEYHIFDYMPNNLSATSEERMNRLNRLRVVPEGLVIVRAELVEDVEDYDWLHKKWVGQGYEGSMLRRMKSKYVNSRSSSLLKRKDFQTKEAKIVRVEEGNGRWRGAVKSLGLVNFDGIGFDAGVRGTWEEMHRLWEKRKFLLGRTCTYRYIYVNERTQRPQLPVVINTDRWDI